MEFHVSVTGPFTPTSDAEAIRDTVGAGGADPEDPPPQACSVRTAIQMIAARKPKWRVCGAPGFTLGIAVSRVTAMRFSLIAFFLVIGVGSPKHIIDNCAEPTSLGLRWVLDLQPPEALAGRGSGDKRAGTLGSNVLRVSGLCGYGDSSGQGQIHCRRAGILSCSGPIVAARRDDYVCAMRPVIDSRSAATRRVASARTLARVLLSGTLIVGSAAAVAAGTTGQTAEAATAAKWESRQLHFSYVGTTAHYSCDGLREQIKAILQRLGASADLVVKASGCVRLAGPEPFPGVEATFSVLESAGADQAAAGSKDVTARWDKVTLDSDVPGRTGAGQCELIEQVKKQVLPLFTTRNLSYSDQCSPHSESLSGARLSVEVLRPVKSPPAEPTSP